MKIRHGFVSNSSSSSFIAVPHKIHTVLHDKIAIDNYHHDYLKGEYEFGWDMRVYKSFDSKLNFLLLFAYNFDREVVDKKDDKYFISYLQSIADAGESVSLESLMSGLVPNIVRAVCEIKNSDTMTTDLLYEGENVLNDPSDPANRVEQYDSFECGYIDHQSEWREYHVPLYILIDVNEIKQFLANPDSCVVGCNDNETSEKVGPYKAPFIDDTVYRRFTTKSS